MREALLSKIRIDPARILYWAYCSMPGLVDFAIRLLIFVLILPDGQVLFFGEIQITEGL